MKQWRRDLMADMAFVARTAEKLQARAAERGYRCPRGHKRYTAGNFCSVCGAGPPQRRRGGSA